MGLAAWRLATLLAVLGGCDSLVHTELRSVGREVIEWMSIAFRRAVLRNVADLFGGSEDGGLYSCSLADVRPSARLKLWWMWVVMRLGDAHVVHQQALDFVKLRAGSCLGDLIDISFRKCELGLHSGHLVHLVRCYTIASAFRVRDALSRPVYRTLERDAAHARGTS